MLFSDDYPVVILCFVIDREYCPKCVDESDQVPVGTGRRNEKISRRRNELSRRRNEISQRRNEFLRRRYI